MLVNFKDLEVTEAKLDKLKDQIKSQIETVLNKEDGVDTENVIKITKISEFIEIKDTHITEIAMDITVIGQFKVGKLTEQFILNTKVIKLISAKTIVKNAVEKLTKYTNDIKTVKLKEDLIFEKLTANGVALGLYDIVAFDKVIFVEGTVQVGNEEKNFKFTIRVVI